MKLTKSKLKQIIKEALQDRGPGWKAGEGKVPNVDELAEWYWKALMSGQEVFLSQDLGSIWIPLAKGEDLKNIEIPSHTAAEWVKQMDAENVRHYAKGVQNALIEVFKDVLSDTSKLVDPRSGGTDYGKGEKKMAGGYLQKIFDAIGVNPSFARQIPGFEGKYAWKGQQTESKVKLTKSKLKQIIKEELEAAMLTLEMSDTGSYETDKAGGCEDKGGTWSKELDKCVFGENKDDDFLGDVKSTGEWTDYTIEQLKTKIAAANKKQEAYKKKHGKADPAITKKLRQMNFSKNAKEGDYKEK
jgi:hypothetical protein